MSNLDEPAKANGNDARDGHTDPKLDGQSLFTNGSSSDTLTPKALFQRMADRDKLLNSRMSASVNGLESAGTVNLVSTGCHKRGATRMRFIVCTLGLVSLALSQMSRTVLNYSITLMVDEKFLNKENDTHIDQSQKPADGSCPWPEDNFRPPLTTTTPATTESLVSSISPNEFQAAQQWKADSQALNQFEFSTIGPYEEEMATMQRITIVAPARKYEQFEWSMKDQQVLLGGFFYSYFVFMVFGGRMAEIYGAKYVLLLSVAGSAVIDLATPWMASNSFGLLFASRVLMGALQSGVFPGMYALINKWLTMSEASIFAPLIKMNLRLGSVLASLSDGVIEGWPNVFYCTGALCAVWSVLWCLVATSDPAENYWVSQDELAHINREKQVKRESKDLEINTIELNGTNEGDKVMFDRQNKIKNGKEPKTPWIKILTSPSVIGLIFVKLTFNYALDFLSILLPSYLRYVHHMSKGKRSSILTPMFAIQVVLIFFVGWLAKFVVQKRPYAMSKTTIRKLFQGIASFGLATSLLLFTFNACSTLLVVILLQLASFLSMFTAGGETMLPYDLSSKYPATIMAIANSIANVSAVTSTTLAGFILSGQSGSYERWNVLIYLIVGMNLLGGLAFTLLVKAKPIDFSGDNKSQQASKKDNKKEIIEIDLHEVDK